MNSWMKRRIDRSRARCQKAADEQKETVRREKQQKTGRNEQEAKSPRELSHTSSNK